MLRRPFAILLAGLLAACSADDLLHVDQPILTPETAANATGAQALRAAALASFATFFAGSVDAWAISGLMSDELINARSGWEHVDQRSFNENLSPNPWGDFSALQRSARVAVVALRRYVPDDDSRKSEIGHLYALSGFGLVMGAEIYCNGMPFSDVAGDGTITYDPHMYTNAEVFQLAVSQFDSALASFPAADPLRNLARIGKARALLDLNKPDDAAAVVRAGGDGASSSAVATTYVYNVEYSSTTVPNGISSWVNQSANFGVPITPEGGNGLNWKADPRINVQPLLRNGQDGVTPVYPPGVSWSRTSDSPVPLATGTEARLIEAEADLRANRISWLTTLNTLRRSSAVAAQLPVLDPPPSGAPSVSLLFAERAMWMYLTAHRLGDLRRLIRQYGRTQDQVFPTGPYFKGGVYGSDVNITPPFAERANLYYKGCLDRGA